MKTHKHTMSTSLPWLGFLFLLSFLFLISNDSHLLWPSAGPGHRGWVMGMGWGQGEEGAETENDN